MSNQDPAAKPAEAQVRPDDPKRGNAPAEQAEPAQVAEQKTAQSAVKAAAVGRVLGRRFAGLFGKR